MSLRHKILFGIIAIYSLTLGILAVLLSLDFSRRDRIESQERESEIRETNRYLSDLVQELIDEYLKGLDEITIRKLLDWQHWPKLAKMDPVLLTIEESEETFINPSGVPFRPQGQDSSIIRERIREALHQKKVIMGENYVAAPLDVGSIDAPIWGVYFKKPLGTRVAFRPLLNVRLIFILMVLGIPLITGVTYSLLSRMVIRPIERLQAANRRVAAGDYASELPRSSGRNDEIDELIGSFNSMLRDVRDYHQNLEEKVQEATEKIRQTEQRLITAQRLAATGQLAAGIAHEINNPLGGMINITRKLIPGDQPPDRRREYLDLILEGLERIQATVGKMLPLSIREVQPQVVDLRKVIRQVLDLARYRTDRPQIQVSWEVPPGDFLVYGDPHELHQVFLNILINALDAIGAQGEIRIRGRLEPAWVITSIADTGCGMTEEQVAGAFDLFYTTKEVGEGTGLGLSIVHNIVANHGGVVSLKSRPGAGTTVEVRLPVAAGNPG